MNTILDIYLILIMPRNNKNKMLKGSTPPHIKSNVSSKLNSGESTPNTRRRKYIHKEVTREILTAINILRNKETTDSKT